MLQEEKKVLRRAKTCLGWNAYNYAQDTQLPYCENLGAGDVLRVRPKRGLVDTWAAPKALLTGSQMYSIRGDTLFLGETTVDDIGFFGGKERKMALLGDYLAIWPDKVAVNVQDPSDFFSLERTFAGQIQVSAWGAEGQEVSQVDALPEQAQEEQTAVVAGKRYVFRAGLWRADQRELWLRLQGTGLGAGFANGDGVELTLGGQVRGCGRVESCASDQVILSGFYCANASGVGVLKRRVPELDQVISCGDRLFGCRYIAGVRNSLFACEKGNLRNWVAQGSWQSDRGEAGAWTGAVSLGGKAVFTKEQAILSVSPKEDGQHAVAVLDGPGVAQGSEKSLVVGRGKAYYLALPGVMEYDGGYPREIGQALGSETYTDGVGVYCNGQYYLSAVNSWRIPQLLCYDLDRKLWRREDQLRALFLAQLGGKAYALEADGKLWDLEGSEGYPEGDIPFAMHLPRLCLEKGQRLHAVQLDLELEGSLEVFIQFDGQEPAPKIGQVEGCGLKRVLLPVPRRKADHIQLQLEGIGPCVLHGVVYELKEAGGQ